MFHTSHMVWVCDCMNKEPGYRVRFGICFTHVPTSAIEDKLGLRKGIASQKVLVAMHGFSV